MRRLGWLCLGWLMAMPALAQDIPPALKDWQGWVLHDVPQHACPLLAGTGGQQCVWADRLSLDAGRSGATFAFDVHLDAPSWVFLPGDSRYWPMQVTGNGKALPVLARSDAPAVWLDAGDYSLRGNLPWTSRPARIALPSAIGLVALTVDGGQVEHVERNDDQLTLGEAAAPQREADASSLRVYRELADGMPGDLETRLILNVTGSAREQLLGPVLPKGFAATGLESDIPARLENDGRLRVQLRPGQWTISVLARRTELLSHVALSLPAEPWPRQEVWSYRDAPELRSTRVQGQAVDAGQSGVPDEWRELPAFALDNDNGLSIEQGLRAGEGGKGDQLHLRRQLWLDFDGKALNASDVITGDLRRQLRLDVGAPWQLMSATQNETPLQITKSSDGHQGVELRVKDLDLRANLRVPHDGRLSTAGWLTSFEDIEARLHLPYGYRLLGAPGADRSPDSWVAQWSLLDLFVVAVIALLAGRVLGWRWALVALGFLVLSQHEGGAPRWTLGLALALALLAQALPAGRLRGGARIGAGALLALAALWSLPFAAQQMNYALHPQLESGPMASVDLDEGVLGGYASHENRKQMVRPQADAAALYAPGVEEATTYASPPAPPPPRALRAPPKVIQQVTPPGAQALSGITVTPVPIEQRFATKGLVQAGAGAPAWDVGNDYTLGWSGPVTAEQTTRLIIAPSWLVRCLRVVMLGLLLALLGCFVRHVLPQLRGWRPGKPMAQALAVWVVLCAVPHAAHAQALPDAQMLEQLRTRLVEQPKCQPHCAQLASLTVQAEGDRVSLDLDVHLGAPSGVRLPDADAALQLTDVLVDGKSMPATFLRGEGLWVRLERGVHRVTLRYRVAATADAASLRFAQPAPHVQFSGNGWRIDGVDDGRALGDSLALHRVRDAADGEGKDKAVAQAFPPYVTVARTFELGVDWSVTTVVSRMAPESGGFSLELPLLPGEHPLGEGLRVRDGKITVTFNGDDDDIRWTSRLDHADKITLKAPALGERAESWRVSAGPMWHIEAKGVPTQLEAGDAVFSPLPGETLELQVSEPATLAGDSLAFDSVRAESKVGDRATELSLMLGMRSTRGGEHVITLPQGAELMQAARDGTPLELAIRDGKLSLPVLPGRHTYGIALRLPSGVGVRVDTPALDLKAPVANVTHALNLPQDRWVLWTWGPTAGPAVLYWSQLVVLLVAAWLLGRFAPTPLRFHHWLLLGLGFSAFAWSAYALVVAWLIVLGLRERASTGAMRPALFNVMQVALAVLTVIAVVVLIGAVPQGLLGLPDMHVAGNDSSAWDLKWFTDKTAGALPGAGVFSVSLWVYKAAMLLWALWLANALIGWLRWVFQAWSHGGYWRKRETKLPPPQPEPETHA